MNRNAKKFNLESLRLQALRVGWLFGCFFIVGEAIAVAMPKGNCADPKPYTDLRHCRFEGADLRNKDLRGADLRVISLYETLLQGANLESALFDRNRLLMARLDGAHGLPQDILTTLFLYKAINKNNYLVAPSGNSNSTITLSPHEAVQGIQGNIAGLASIHMLSKVENDLHTVAVFDWPRYSEGKRINIVARFDNDNFDIPSCYKSVTLLNDDQYYYPSWSSMKVKQLANGNYLIGVEASGSDGDDMGVEGWDMVAFLKLSPACELSVLHKEDNGWSEGANNTECQGVHLDYRFLDEDTAEIKLKAHICGSFAKSKTKISYKKIKLNLHN